MKDRRSLLIVAILGCSVILMVIILVLIFTRPKENVQKEGNPTITPAPTLTSTPSPTPTKKPDIIWDKPTGKPGGTDVTVDPTVPNKPEQGGSTEGGGSGGDSSGNKEDEKEEVNIDTMGTGLNYNDYVTVDEDGTIHINMDKYTEDINKKMEEN